ncbi:DNA-processing protein DprA [Candidatus Saccharibacteria bacterium]|nr:DNA-processing protein DprA [Candidatus Saccharibacteria bacterium]
MKINTISPDTNNYIQILTHIAKPPKKLDYIGVLPNNRRPSVAVVGTRKPTSYGIEVTSKITSELARHGIIIISGLALGVDAIAHRSALESGGVTIAILANGLPNIYPASNASLGKEIILNGGAVISEYPQHSRARPYQFLERNRLVSGLADAIIITEASARSGTLNTASRALEQGKDVFVVPGPITSPMSFGCNQLIKQGASPLTSSRDIIELLMPSDSKQQTSLPLGDTPLEDSIIKLFSDGIRDGDEIRNKLSVSAAELSQALTMLEINGIIRSLGANQWTLA